MTSTATKKAQESQLTPSQQKAMKQRDVLLKMLEEVRALEPKYLAREAKKTSQS